MAPVISVSNLSKRYVLNHLLKEHHATLRDALGERVKRLLTLKGSPGVDPAREDYWALRDVSFEVREGERLGVVGRNGAGKSTLLKILSRITEPTTGRISIRGRVASLLEVGTGFHAELSGRENIYLSGAILGMRREEIDRKFDEIVTFSEIEKFLDTPVKRYSSGMYVRLAFAVAAHLEADILIVDEVLAVGDSQFQKKCLGKIEDASFRGRTVLFVSHSMAAIKHLCTSAMYLDRGNVKVIGSTDAAIDAYLRAGEETASIDLKDRNDRVGNGQIRFSRIALRDPITRNYMNSVPSGASFILEISYERNTTMGNLSSFNIAIGIDDCFGNRVSHLSNVTTNQTLHGDLEGGGQVQVEVEVKELPLRKGIYGLTLFATVGGDIADWVKNAGSLPVEEGDFFKTGKLPEEAQGVLYIKHSFAPGGDG